MAPKAIAKKTRFEVFKRDKFTCQYCGRSAPEVILECDHIEPRSKGGTNNILNIVTSCRDCNSGKSDRRLSDGAVVKQQVDQLKDAQERRQQVEMLVAWQKELCGAEDYTVSCLCELWSALVPGHSVSAQGRSKLLPVVRKYTVSVITEAMRRVCTQYLRYENGKVNYASTLQAFAAIPKFCSVIQGDIDDPLLKHVLGLRSYARKVLDRWNDWDSGEMFGAIRSSLDAGVSAETIKREIRNSWSSEDAIAAIRGLANAER